MALVPRPNGRLVFIAGASRSGKTTRLADQVAGSRRLLVWDLRAEWCSTWQCRHVATLAELRELVLPGAPIERLAYHATDMLAPGRFDAFCRLASVWIRAARGDLVIEELAAVTHPGKAPAAWHNIVSNHLRYGPTIYAVTQRPAESDKTALGNASVIRCHRLARPGDRREMAEALDVSPDQVKALRPFEYLERHDTGELFSGLGRHRRQLRESARN